MWALDVSWVQLALKSQRSHADRPGCVTCVCCCTSYPFEIHDDALVLRKMLEHDTAQRFQGEQGGRPARLSGQQTPAPAWQRS